ncbi:hypothetical protein ACFSTI_12690 [Rhizorhabdus histidinilytica]
MRMRQRIETGRPQALRLDLLGRHGGKLVPGDAVRQPDADAALHGLAARHLDAGHRPVRQVVARGEQILLSLGELGFFLLGRLDELGKVHVVGSDRRCPRKQGGDEDE